MKYSLRSLMTFSIRHLFWITVVAALAVGWWVERRGNDLLRQHLEKASANNANLLHFLSSEDIKTQKGEDGVVFRFYGEGLKYLKSSEMLSKPVDIDLDPPESDYQAPMGIRGGRVHP
jgi:hypothetical protein